MWNYGKKVRKITNNEIIGRRGSDTNKRIKKTGKKENSTRNTDLHYTTQASFFLIEVSLQNSWQI